MKDSAKQKFWQQHIQAWQNGALSQSAYCSKHALSLASFGYWRKRFKTEISATAKILPVVREAPGSAPSSVVVGVQLRSPGGWHIALPSTVSLKTLSDLLAALS